MFQKDAQIITREALTTVKAAIASSTIEQKLETKKKAIPRKAAGKSWEDPMLADWPESMIPNRTSYFSWMKYLEELCNYVTI